MHGCWTVHGTPGQPVHCSGSLGALAGLCDGLMSVSPSVSRRHGTVSGPMQCCTEQMRSPWSPWSPWSPYETPCSPPLPSPSELSVAPDYAIQGPADNALHDMVHASATDDMCQRCDNDVACARGLGASTSLLHELVGCDRELGCPAIESWVPLIHAPARDKSAMYKSLFSTASLLFELLNGPLVPSRPTAPCIFSPSLPPRPSHLSLTTLSAVDDEGPSCTHPAPVPALRSSAARAVLNAFRDGRHRITSFISWPAF